MVERGMKRLTAVATFCEDVNGAVLPVNKSGIDDLLGIEFPRCDGDQTLGGIVVEPDGAPDRIDNDVDLGGRTLPALTTYLMVVKLPFASVNRTG